MEQDEAPKHAPNIHQRVNAVMQDVPYVQKVQRKTGLQYTFVNRDAVVAKLRVAMVKHGITYYPNVLNFTESGNRITATVVHTYTNSDHPEDCIVFSTVGYGIDSQDKGPGKAVTYAEKLAHLKLFMIEAGDEDECEHYDEPHNPDAPTGDTGKGKKQPKQPETGSDLEEARLAYSTLRENIGLSNAEMVKAFGGDLKKATADDILAFVAEMNCRHLFYQNVVQAVEQFKPSGPEFDELLEANGAASMAKSWHLVPSKNIMAVHEGIVARWDLPFDEPGSKG